jgi:hypothetical protein
MLVELGNAQPYDIEAGERVDAPYPRVEYLRIPEGNMGRPIGIDRLPDESEEAFLARDAADIAAQEGDPLYSMPDEHDDDLFAQNPVTAHIADALAGVSPDSRSILRRQLLRAHIMDPSTGGLPDHAAFVAVADPLNGFWSAACAKQPAHTPAWVRVAEHPGLEKMLAEHFGCPQGAPDGLEDLYGTYYGTGHYPPGAAPDPLSGFTMLHTTRGRVQQAIQMFGFGPATLMGVGTASAATATTLTGSAETNASRAANECAGMILVVSANSAGTGSKVYGVIISHTSGTTPVYTVDRWYNEATPGGAAGTTPNATSFYSVIAAPPDIFVALSTDTTAKSLGGTAGTADSPTIAQALTGEITTAGGGLIRKIAPIGNSGASVTLTPVFTANGTDSLPVTVGTAAASPSIVATNGALDYMTLVSPTATLSASGDQLTLTWTMTET